VRTVIGPMDGDVYHRFRWNLGPSDVEAFHGEPTNPPYYPSFFRIAGFRQLAGYRSTRVADVTQVLDRLQASANRAVDDGYTLHPLDAANPRDSMRLIHRLSREIFRYSYLNSNIPADQFLAVYDGVERLLDPGLALVAHAPDGEPAGFLFAYAEPSRPDAVNFKTLGVLPAHWRRGVAALLVSSAYEHAAARGRPVAHLCLMHDGNPSGALGGGFAETFRRYALYGRSVA
jgi:GNAT superfamily N-acetyltransferase